MSKFIEKYKNLMESFAMVLSDSLSSMTMFWIISLLVIVPLFFVQPVGLVGWMQYIVSVFFQGVALPVLGYTSKLGGARTDSIIKKIEELSEKIERQTEEIGVDVDDVIDDVDKIIEELSEKIERKTDEIGHDVDNAIEDVSNTMENVDNAIEDFENKIINKI
jgi:ElaB/YqjD/DUF883 family membrane-anchored ribosome-binding protein